MKRYFSLSRLPLVAVLCLGWLAVSCSPVVGIEQPVIEGWRAPSATLEPGQTAGQTFTARYDGLSGFVVYLQPTDASSGDLLLRLFSGPSAETVLQESRLPLEQIDGPGFYRFSFPPITHSHRQGYYAEISIQGSGQLFLGAGPGEAYLQGSRYAQGESQDDQLAFRLVYDRQSLFLGLLAEGLGWLLLLAVGLFLFTLPGWALLQLAAPSWPAWRSSSAASRLFLSSAAGLVVIPVLLLLTGLLGLRPGPLLAWLPSLAAALWLVWKLWTGPRPDFRFALSRLRHDWRLSPPWAGLALLAVATAVILTRFWNARELPAPMFGDSLQHTMITQLIIDHRGLFESWAPYAPLETFTYHFAFHGLSAALVWLLGFPTEQAVLWMGQLLNILAVLALYPLAARAGRSPWAGVVAVIVGGLLSPMPGYYLNWGRYTQLTGQAILPLAIFLAWDTLKEPGGQVFADSRRSSFDRLRLPLLTGIVFSGLALAHYRVLILAALFMLAALALFLFSRLRNIGHRDFTSWWSPLSRSLLAALVAGLIFLPWLLRTFNGNLLTIFNAKLNASGAGTAQAAVEVSFFSDLTSFLPAVLWLLLVICLAWGLWRRERWAALLGAWSLIMLLVANPNWLGLPGAGAVDNFAVFIAAYIPASLLVGSASGWLVNALSLDCPTSPVTAPGAISPASRLWRTASGSLLLLSVLLLAAWGLRQRVAEVYPAQFALVTDPDLRAAAWIRQETSPEAQLLINSFSAYGGTAVVGADAGWWLPLLAGRQVNIPPLNYSLEGEPWSGYRDWVAELPSNLKTLGFDDPAALDLLHERGITHIYIGQQQGRVNAPGPAQLDPQALLALPEMYRPVYHQDRVWIFEVQD